MRFDKSQLYDKTTSHSERAIARRENVSAVLAQFQQRAQLREKQMEQCLPVKRRQKTARVGELSTSEVGRKSPLPELLPSESNFYDSGVVSNRASGSENTAVKKLEAADIGFRAPQSPESGRRGQRASLLGGISLLMLGLGFAIWGFVSNNDHRPTGSISNDVPALTLTNAESVKPDDLFTVASPIHSTDFVSSSTRLTTVNIEDIRCGMRVPAFNPEVSDAERESQLID